MPIRSLFAEIRIDVKAVDSPVACSFRCGFRSGDNCGLGCVALLLSDADQIRLRTGALRRPSAVHPGCLPTQGRDIRKAPGMAVSNVANTAPCCEARPARCPSVVCRAVVTHFGNSPAPRSSLRRTTCRTLFLWKRVNIRIESTTGTRYCGAWFKTRTNPSSVMELVASLSSSGRSANQASAVP